MRHVFQVIAVFGGRDDEKVLSEWDIEGKARSDLSSRLNGYADLMGTVTLFVKEVWTNATPPDQEE